MDPPVWYDSLQTNLEVKSDLRFEISDPNKLLSKFSILLTHGGEIGGET